MWNAWTAPPGARSSDYEPWSCEAHCARCGELAQDCHCEDDGMSIMSNTKDGGEVIVECGCGNRDTISLPITAMPPCSAGCGRRMRVVGIYVAESEAPPKPSTRVHSRLRDMDCRHSFAESCGPDYCSRCLDAAIDAEFGTPREEHTS